MRKNRCPTFSRHVRRQAGRSAETETYSHLMETAFFFWVSKSHLMLGCSSWRLDMNLN